MKQDSMAPVEAMRVEQEAQKAFLARRHRVSEIWRSFFMLTTLIAVIFLATLLVTIVNDSMGYVFIESKVDPAALSSKPLSSLNSSELATIIRANLSKNRVTTLERIDGVLEQQNAADLFQVVEQEVVQARVVESYTWFESLFNKGAIFETAQKDYPGATVEFHYWLNREFIVEGVSSIPEYAGVRTALEGSLLLMAITILIAFPIGVGAAIYLEEYAKKDGAINRFIQTNIDNLAGVPSIVYGILGLALFVRTLQQLTSGAIFGAPVMGNGRTILSAGLTMALLILPVIIINAQEAIRAVPDSLRQASFGLGATRWQTVWSHVLPSALPGILTGTILAFSRAIGETAPLIVVGASTLLTSSSSGIFSPFSALPIQIYNWTMRPQPAFQHIASAAILVLLISLLTLNAFAILLRNRFTKRD